MLDMSVVWVICRHYNWSIAAPLLVSQAVFNRPLTDVCAVLESFCILVVSNDNVFFSNLLISFFISCILSQLFITHLIAAVVFFASIFLCFFNIALMFTFRSPHPVHSPPGSPHLMRIISS